jgi:predicted patatin/cPLA2 family phospholipase
MRRFLPCTALALCCSVLAATAADRVGNAQINADVLLASACLPLMHQAIEVDGDAYWDVFVVSLPPGFSSAIPLARATKKGLL